MWRVLSRLPLWVYWLGLGPWLGERFVKLEHVGRRSGLRRETVLEVLRYAPEEGLVILVSGFGEQAQWYQNVLREPDVVIELGRCRWFATARPLSGDRARDELHDYSRRHPWASRFVAHVFGGGGPLEKMAPRFRLVELRITA